MVGLDYLGRPHSHLLYFLGVPQKPAQTMEPKHQNACAQVCTNGAPSKWLTEGTSKHIKWLLMFIGGYFGDAACYIYIYQPLQGVRGNPLKSCNTVSPFLEMSLFSHF